MTDELQYMTGFGNEHATEALPGALPVGRNAPQRAPYGLYTEVFSGTAFTAPRASNRRSWLYRIRPTVATAAQAREIEPGLLLTAPDDAPLPVVPLRWNPVPIPDEETDFAEGWRTMASNGSALAQFGVGIHIYVCNRSMDDRYLQHGDGELLVVPQQGRLRLRTEAGILQAGPGEICVIPRGMRFAVDVLDGPSRGYICENYGAHLRLPELGPIGSNCLANARDFRYPVAAYEDREEPCDLVTKAGGRLYITELKASPLDVVAWHGNCAPYVYDLERFNTIGTISYDHPDPSIYTVLTSPSDTAGVANIDFVIFPSRWLVAEDTFRPPWYHRNIMSEYMGLVYGVYDAKPEGFVPGGGSLHNCFVPHGPASDAFENASGSELAPVKLENTMAFMFESRYPYQPSEFAMNGGCLQPDYLDCWRDIKRNFDPEKP